MERLILSNFKKLLLYLTENNAYYGEILRKVDVANCTSLDELLSQIPVTTKKDINSNYEKYISRMDGRYHLEITSGSTGTPLKCLKSNQERMKAAMALWRERRRRDHLVTHDNFFPIVGNQDIYDTIGDFCNFDNENMVKCFNSMMKTNPRWLYGPVTALYRYAKLIRNGDVEYRKGSVKFIELNGVYADKREREYIENVFGAKTIDNYGTRECWCIAYECEYGKMHVLNDMVYVEVIHKRNIEDKEAGEIVITSFNNYLMPFVRYNLGDLGSVKTDSCPCGKYGQMIELVGGRTGDIIKGRREMLGDIIFKRIITDLIEAGYDCINGFRGEQRTENHFTLYIEKSRHDVDFTDLLTTFAKKHLGQEREIEIVYVDQIPVLPSGKSQTFVSYVN